MKVKEFFELFSESDMCVAFTKFEEPFWWTSDTRRVSQIEGSILNLEIESVTFGDNDDDYLFLIQLKEE